MRANSVKGRKGLSRRKIIISVITVVCILVIAIFFFTRNREDAIPQSNVSEATATTGEISNTIIGTGNLQIDASDSIEIPSGITVTKVKVESGDSVSKGDVLAVVDKTSVLEAIQTVQDEIDSLDEKIDDSKDVDETSSVTAKVSGTIKKIYAKKGDSVTDCVAENGALMVIVPDGDTDGVIQVVADGGTVSKISVSKSEDVSVGDTLLTIENDEESTEYKKLVAQRKALAKSFKILTSLSRKGKIVADKAGVVGEVNVSEGEESVGSAENSSTSSESGSTSSGNGQTTTSGSSSSSYSSLMTAFTLSSDDTMLLSVNVDELDINSVSKKQEATVTLDAIEDKTFTGKVTKVSNSASSSESGVVKYTVEITIPKDEQMKAGMNASATITVEKKENILTLPVNALQERGNQSFVYTGKDSEGNLSGEVEVTTGLSDGDNVEITEGLSDGDVVYYQKTGKTSQMSTGFDKENRGDRGEMPGGYGGSGQGNMPEGGFKRGDN